MDKDKFTKWMREKTNCIIVNTTDKQIKNKGTEACLKGLVTVMEEIKTQVENEKFDK